MGDLYHIEGIGKLSVSENDYLASGGEASVYVKNKMAIKIYHDPCKMIPTLKVKELQNISSQNVLIPQHTIYNEEGIPVGYTTTYEPNNYPLCKIFTKSFKTRNNISVETINTLVSQMQTTIRKIHNAKCLIVDLNEMNELIDSTFNCVYFIDVDSYQTPSFKATAIMENIRDRTISNNKWNEGSDWFSFAVMSMQMWAGIHPYKGRHPDYKPSEWTRRMDEGVSIFNPKVTLPKTCSNLSEIPQSHLKWMESVFVDGNRNAPPAMNDSISMALSTSFSYTNTSKEFVVELIGTYKENIRAIFNVTGINYILGKNKIYKENSLLPIEINSTNEVFVCLSLTGIRPIICVKKEDCIHFYQTNGMEIDKITASSMMVRNNILYTTGSGNLIEHSFVQTSSNIIHSCRKSASIMELSSQIFEGVILQNIMGYKYITIPYQKNMCANICVKELQDYRILSAKSERNICVVMAEKQGKYSRFVLEFDASYVSYKLRISEDVSYTNVNFTVLPNGVTALATEDKVEIFKGKNIKTIVNPPFDSSKYIFTVSGIVNYVDANKVYSARIKT